MRNAERGMPGKASQGHPGVKAEGRMKDAERRDNAIQSHHQATCMRQACEEHAGRMRGTLVFTSCLARVHLVFRSWSPHVFQGRPTRCHGGWTALIRSFDCTGLAAIQMASPFSVNRLFPAARQFRQGIPRAWKAVGRCFTPRPFRRTQFRSVWSRLGPV
jgi:hypothetical protein